MEETPRRYTFVVAEPSLALQKFISHCLKSLGDTLPAYTATGLLKKLEGNEVDVLITEIDHWDMEIVELYNTIKERYEKLPIVLMTTRTIYEVEGIGSMREYDTLMLKPFSREKLLETVAQIIDTYVK